MRMVRGLVVSNCLLVAFAVAVHADPPPADAAAPVVVDLQGESIRLEPPGLAGLERRTDGDEQLKAWWTGVVDESEVLIEMRAFDNKDGVYGDPRAMSAYVQGVLRDPEYGGDKDFAFSKVEVLKGKFGPCAYATLSVGPLPNAKEPKGEILVLGGVLGAHAYTVRVVAKPALAGASRERALQFLRQGVTATYAAVDPKWTADDAKKRWDASVDDPKVRAALRPVVRTKHYIVFTDSGAGPLFAKKMESCYEQIQKTYPFDEIDGQRLLPVFLFKDQAEYVQFAVKVSGWSDKEADATKGHAWKDFYATSYDSPNDPVHIHEATHQIFMNRLNLVGGGSWFQEGVAEYMCTQPGERKGFARNAARSGKFAPFREFIRCRELIAGVGGIEGGAAYTQAASLIEFLRDGKFHPEKFQTFVHELGSLPRDDGDAIDAKIQAIYGVDVDTLEKEWVKYWSAK